MDKNKYVITRLTNRKPISLNNIETIQEEGGVFFNYHETMISQIVEARENKEFECICSQIQEFIEKENIDTCFVINKDELVDCLQEHQKLKLQIKDLEHRLANCIEPKFKVGQIVWHCYKNCNAPVKTVIESIDIEVNKEFIDFTYYDIAGFGFDKIMLFATEEEAKAKLREIQDGN